MKTRVLNSKNPLKDPISRIRFAPNSNNLLVSSFDSSLRLYDVDSSNLRLEASIDPSLLDCCFKSESVALSANSDGSIHSFDLESGSNVSIGNHDDIATSIEYSDQTGQIISASLDKKILLWDTRSSKSLRHLINLEVGSMSVTGYSLIVSSESSVYIYDLRNHFKPLLAKHTFMDVHIKCIRQILGSQGFVVGSVDGRVALEYIDQQNPINEGYVFRCHQKGKGKNGKRDLVTVNDIAFRPNHCGVFVTGDNEGYATIWDGQSKKRLSDLERYPNSVASLSYNWDGLLLAVASSFTYQEANEREEPPLIFIHEMD